MASRDIFHWKHIWKINVLLLKYTPEVVAQLYPRKSESYVLTFAFRTCHGAINRLVAMGMGRLKFYKILIIRA
jgi:hypothetical protein